MIILIRLNGKSYVLMFRWDTTLGASHDYVCIFDGVMPGRSAPPNTEHSRFEDGTALGGKLVS